MSPAVLLTLAATLARAELVVVPVLVGEPAASRSEVVAAVASAVEARAQLRRISPEEVFVIGPEILGARVSECGADAGCLARALRALSATHGVVVVVNALAEPAFLDVRLVSIEAERIMATAPGVLEGTSLVEAVRRRTDIVLTEGGFSPSARLDVEVKPETATVAVSPAPLGGEAPGTLWLAPGRHRLIGAAPGFQPARREVDLSAGAQRSLALELSPEPPELWEKGWFWAAVGGGVAAVAAATVAAVVATRDPCICVGRECPTCR